MMCQIRYNTFKVHAQSEFTNGIMEVHKKKIRIGEYKKIVIH